MIKLEVNCSEVPVEFFTFSGGEEQVKIDTSALEKRIQVVEVFAHIKSSKEVMQLVLLTDAIRRLSDNGNVRYYLNMPYVPYARQDRVMEEGEALSIKAFSSIINGLKYDRVFVSDPHSDVTAAVLDNLAVQDQTACFFETMGDYIFTGGVDNNLVVAPDAGARKKAAKIAKCLGFNIIEAGKSRDVKTGQITGTEVYGDVSGKDCLIVDDIADGMATFIYLGEELKKRGAGKVVLFVTHGIFAKGIDIALGKIDEIYCFNPWIENIEGRNVNNIYRTL